MARLSKYLHVSNALCLAGFEQAIGEVVVIVCVLMANVT